MEEIIMKKTSKILSIILAILMAISIIPITASAETPTSGKCGDNLTWEFDESTNTLTISGIGEMYRYDCYFNASNDEKDDRPWRSYTSKIKNIIINEGVTTISEKAFYNYRYLFFVTIPSSITRIEDEAFYSWDGIMAINYLGSEEDWNNINIGYGNADLYNCDKFYFKDDYIPVSGSGTSGDNLTWMFDATTFTLSFSGTGDMEGFQGDGGIFSEPNFFDGCRPWEDFEFEVKHIVISEGITSIGKNAFAMFINLESVEIPRSITQIGSYSFGYCINLTDVYYSGTENDWNNIIKGDIFPGLNLVGNSYNVPLDNATKHYDYHVHDYNVSTTVPTCTEQGYTTYTCECGDSYIDDYVDALGHDMIIDEAIAPDCINTGLTEGSHCSRCDDATTEQEIVPELGHGHKAVITPPTCTEQGYTTYTCECGDSYVDDYIDATGHLFGDWVVTKEPTTDTEGEMERVCFCGEKEYNAIEKLSAVDDKEEVEDTNKEDAKNPEIPNTDYSIKSSAHILFVVFMFVCVVLCKIPFRKKIYNFTSGVVK
ncbi:MAG: leucine-rich repeat domain-containing protein [Ruminococcaceae bacterium]|nr:leucine-rich repeat domain-containing protein [Oscillospiraceae bacterium]